MRNVGLDVHKKYTYYTEVDELGAVLRRGKVSNEELPSLFADEQPRRAVLEAGRNWYHFFDSLEGLVEEVQLAHPLRTRAIAAAKVKTDKVDSATLAQLLRANLIPTAYTAPVHVREEREVLRYRASLVGLRTRVKNKIHAVVAKRGLICPWSDLFGKNGRLWLAAAPLPIVYRQTVEGYLRLLDGVNAEIDLVTDEVKQRVQLSDQAKLLMTIPGIGMYSGLLLLAEIGDIQRFPAREHLISYAGLAPIVRSSGGKTRYGPISKQGSPWLRWILVQAAHVAPKHDPDIRERFKTAAARRGNKVATVDLARHILKIVYQVLKTGRPYRPSGRSSSTCQ
jgi:transposase